MGNHEALRGVSRHKGKVLISLVITTLAMSLLLVAFTLSLTAYNSVKGVSVAQEMTIFTNQGSAQNGLRT